MGGGGPVGCGSPNGGQYSHVLRRSDGRRMRCDDPSRGGYPMVCGDPMFVAIPWAAATWVVAIPLAAAMQ